MENEKNDAVATSRHFVFVVVDSPSAFLEHASTMTGQRAKVVLGRSVAKSERTKGERYLDNKGQIAIWNGKGWRCEHGRVRSTCKECGGSQICEHGRRRSQCKECGGGSICEHGRVRRQCKECGGASICEHGRQRSQCKDCGGSQICEHGRVRSVCKECGGSQICEHGRQRSQCKECGGSQICEHGRQRSYCKEKECKARRNLAATARSVPVPRKRAGGRPRGKPTYSAPPPARESTSTAAAFATSHALLAVQPLVVSASDVAFYGAADDTAMSLALPPR